MVYTGRLTLTTRGFCDFHDVTGQVESVLRESGLSNGILTVFAVGSTCAITTIEFESGALSDLRKAIERIAPADIHYEHDSRWGDGNGFSHVRAALLPTSVTIPVIGGKLSLGTWQQIVFIDFDNRARRREIIVQVVGE